MRLVLLMSLAIVLSGCQVTSDRVDVVAHQVAKGVEKGVVAQKFPGVNVASSTDCVIDIAKAGATGVTPATVETVTTIATLPQTVQCISKNGLGLFL